MKSADDLKQLLQNIDRKSYPAYKGTKGVYRFGKYALGIDHVQGDPFAAPSSLHIEVSGKVAAFPELSDPSVWRSNRKIFISGERIRKEWNYFCDQMWSGNSKAERL